MSPLDIVLITLVALLLGLGLGFVVRGGVSARARAQFNSEARQVLDTAQRDAERLVKDATLQAKELALRAQEDQEQEIRGLRHEVQELERRLRLREEALERRSELQDREAQSVEERRRELERRGGELAEREEKLAAGQDQLVEKIEQLSGLSRDEARQALIDSVEAEAKLEAARRVKRIEEEAREQSDRRAKRIIAMAIQRYAGEYVTERTVSVVNLPNEEMKGRIIGREGRNIRALEAATGVDLIIDDTPEAVVISAFNPLRREIARLSLERLIADGRIHPTRIEEIVRKVEEEVESAVKEAGEQAAFDLDLHGIHPDLLRYVGQLRYRTSYGQNQYKHAIEVAFLAGMMASELGLNVKKARRAGLLHDIGKIIDQSAEGSHAVIGAEAAKKCGESPVVVNAIASHHEEVPKESVYAVLVQAADALSGARPGARREILEGYIRRLEDLENIANSFPGVEKSYAIQAGRELRVVVANNGVSDAEAIAMSREIARRVESELTYPGQIKVTVIRETRAVEYAR